MKLGRSFAATEVVATARKIAMAGRKTSGQIRSSVSRFMMLPSLSVRRADA